jgi:hypothetical protein
MATPCFVIMADKVEENKKMLCAPSIGEKELWL